MKIFTKTLSIFVPKEAGSLRVSKWLAGQLNTLVNAGSGYTLTTAVGGWLGEDGPVHERVYRVDVGVLNQTQETIVRDWFEGVIQDLLTTGKQEAVMADLGAGSALYFPEDIA